jgi:phosphopantetheinyl transferase
MPRWEPVRATEGSVHIWRADLRAIGDQPAQLLCKEELARAAGIVPERKRVLWARSRGVLRTLLGRYLDRDPRELRFTLGPHGKPALVRARVGPTEDLRFNLSHSGSLALYAVTVGRELGIDIECARERYTDEFLRAWVAHEAVVKCRGVGLATPLESPHPDDLWTAELNVGPPAAAAVAVAGGPCELRCYLW